MTESAAVSGASCEKNLEPTRKIYVVLTQTGTILSRILKLVTRAPYNHSSLAMTDDLQTMYSFGRLNPYNPFWGGYVQESPAYGTFKRFKNTVCVVLEMEVTESAYADMEEHLQYMLEHRKDYHYNYCGLFAAPLQFHRERENHFYCSEFVRRMLLRMNAPGIENVPPIVKPIHFVECMPHRVIYTGRLQDYTPPIHS
jgi:hypothetical protein